MVLRILAVSLIVLALAPFLASADFKYESAGRRDPFVPLIGREKPTVTRLEDVTSIDDVVLEGIVVDAGGRRAAVLNNVILRENDKVGYVEVKKISMTTVSLSIGSKMYEKDLSEKGGQKSGQ